MAKKSDAKKKEKPVKTEAKSDNKAYEKKMAELAKAKEAATAAFRTQQSFVLKHKLKAGEKPSDKKVAKAYKEAQDAYQALKKTKEALEAEVKALKPAAKEKTKYNYPSSVNWTDDLKKKYRTRMRALAEQGITGKEAEKTAITNLEGSSKPAPAKKKAGKEEAPKGSKKSSKPEKSSGKDKKKKKKKASKED